MSDLETDKKSRSAETDSETSAAERERTAATDAANELSFESKSMYQIIFSQFFSYKVIVFHYKL